MFLHDYLLACEISTVRLQCIINQERSVQQDIKMVIMASSMAPGQSCFYIVSQGGDEGVSCPVALRDKTTINFQNIYHIASDFLKIPQLSWPQTNEIQID